MIISDTPHSEVPTGIDAEAWGKLQAGLKTGLTGQLGITITQLERGRVVGTIPSDDRTVQPFGYLHGGGFACLAETLVSVAGLLLVDFPRQRVVGHQVSLNLMRPAPAGTLVQGEAVCELSGRSSQVWNVTMTDASRPDRTLAVARILLAVVEK